jgi:hypothetical protein
MTTIRPATVLAVLAVSVWGGAVVAQQPPGPPVLRPAYSPYLNLLRQGTSPAINYYGLVRPEQTARQSLQAVQSAVSANQRTIRDLFGNELGQTGVPAQFLNHYGYFQNQRAGGGTPGLGGFQTMSGGGQGAVSPPRKR